MASKLEKIIVFLAIAAIPIFIILFISCEAISTYINNPDSFKASKLVNSYTYKQSYRHFDTFEKEIAEIIAPSGFTLESKGEDIWQWGPSNSPNTLPPLCDIMQKNIILLKYPIMMLLTLR